MKEESAFTVLEIIVVVVIIAILASLTLPNLSKTLSKNREKLAVSNLKMILNAEKLYRARNDKFFPDSGDEAELDKINENLNLDIESQYFDYTVKASGQYSFKAYAKDKNSPGIEYIIDPEGTIEYPDD
ncbi:MAG: prepilin-type N-terminal cleavage/methylation domain-containing protein [Candidatus Kaelpia imicola]|nr:prepilin-type N-terminal cleavage/methylation domain-containing protein [Candidatus Kaelpia imicola]